MSAKVMVLIVNYNGKKFIGDCLESLRRQTYNDFDILVVDNLSTDDSVQFMKQNYKEAKVLSLSANTGFTGGNNEGFRYALNHDYEYVLLLNEDTVTDKELIKTLLEYGGEATAVSPMMYQDKKRREPWYSGGKIDFENGLSDNCHIKATTGTHRVTFLTGCCILLHTSIIKKIGFFDEKFYMYYEDDDLSMRMYLNNIKMLYIADTWIWHRVKFREPRAESIYYLTRNRLYYINKYKKYFIIKNKIIILELLKTYLFKPMPQDLKYRNYVLSGIWDYLSRKMYHRKTQTNYNAIALVDLTDQLYKQKKYYSILNQMYGLKQDNISISQWLVEKEFSKIAIYGIHFIGQRLYHELKENKLNVSFFIDKNGETRYQNTPIYTVEDFPDEADVIIITPVFYYAEIYSTLSQKVNCPILSIEEILDEL